MRCGVIRRAGSIYLRALARVGGLGEAEVFVDWLRLGRYSEMDVDWLPVRAQQS